MCCTWYVLRTKTYLTCKVRTFVNISKDLFEGSGLDQVRVSRLVVMVRVQGKNQGRTYVYECPHKGIQSSVCFSGYICVCRCLGWSQVWRQHFSELVLAC